MENVPLQQYDKIQDVPFPKGHVYLYAPQCDAQTLRCIGEKAMSVQAVGEEPLVCETGRSIVAVGDGETVRRAKQLAVRYRLPLFCLATDYGATQALSPYVVRLRPRVDIGSVQMQTAYVLGRMSATLPDLYAYLLKCYVAAFDEILLARLHNRAASNQDLVAQLRSALISPLSPKEAESLWRLAHRASVLAMPHEAMIQLLSFVHDPLPPNCDFAISACIAEALRHYPNVPPVALPPDRVAVLTRLATLDVGVCMRTTPKEELFRRDWIARATCKEAPAFFDLLDLSYERYRSLLPDYGWQQNADLEGWDLLQLLPLVSEICYDTSALGHLYDQGDFNLWIA